jgi:hypothetical protein
MFGGARGFGCLMELWALEASWSYWFWMFSGAMGLRYLVEL